MFCLVEDMEKVEFRAALYPTWPHHPNKKFCFELLIPFLQDSGVGKTCPGKQQFLRPPHGL